MPQPKDKDWLNGYKTRPLYILSTGDPSQNKEYIQIESEELGEKKKFMQMVTKRKQDLQYPYQIK